MTKIGIVPQVSGVGGMVSFRDKFVTGLQARGIEITHQSSLVALDSLLVIGGTRNLIRLWRAKRCGVRIVQRLNGMNWLHRLRRTGIKHFLRAEYGNLNLQFIRSQLADHIVYQSEFSRQWWQRVYGPTRISNSVVHNAVDLKIFNPHHIKGSTQIPAQNYQLPENRYRILMVEGSLAGGYELGLETAVKLVELLNAKYHAQLGKSVELMVAGRVSEEVKSRWAQKTEISIEWVGLVPHTQIPELDRSAHLLYSSDINAACPNSVIEALACGLPVLAFDTGALPELVTGDSGRVTAYGGDSWKLDPPDIPALAVAAVEILLNYSYFQAAARRRAEAAFSLDQMVTGYLDALIL